MRLRGIFKTWLPFAVVVTAFCALTYVAVQQALRQGLNDPQIQMAEDAAADLNGGETAQGLVAPKYQVNLATSLAPFLIVYDASGEPVAGSGVLDGQLPDYPKGALESAKQNGENRVTWQPNVDVRIASVVVPYENGFVVAGRNMREVEKRESQTETFAGATWLLTLIATFIVIAFGELVLIDKK
jgi:hypothetical protein